MLLNDIRFYIIIIIYNCNDSDLLQYDNFNLLIQLFLAVVVFIYFLYIKYNTLSLYIFSSFFV